MKIEKDDKKEILAFWLNHENGKKKFFKWNWKMLWVLIKYKILLGKDIYSTCIKSVDREEYLIQFLINNGK